MFIGIIHPCLPPSNEVKNKCMNSSWDLTFNENHWSTLETTKQFVHKILLPYLQISNLPFRIAGKLKDGVVARLVICA
jgi:hypothetical protein